MGEKTETKEKPKPEKVALTNGLIWMFNNSPSFNKLRAAPGLRAELKYALYRQKKTVSESAEAKAMQEMIDEIITAHNKTQEDKTKKEPLLLIDPKIQAIFDLDSGLEVKKVVIPQVQLPVDFSAEDMLATDWIIDYIE